MGINDDLSNPLGLDKSSMLSQFNHLTVTVTVRLLNYGALMMIYQPFRVR